MATFKKTLQKNGSDTNYQVILTITETSTSIANNTSTISYELKVKKTAGSGYWTNSNDGKSKVVINGVDHDYVYKTYDFRNTTEITMTSGTQVIPHNSDGTKTIYCKGYFGDLAGNLGSGTATGYFTLTPLHKVPDTTIQIVERDTYLTQNFSITDDEFIANASIKRISLSATAYDSASVVSFNVANGNYNVSTTSITNNNGVYTGTITLDFQNNPLTITESQSTFDIGDAVVLTITTTDSMGGVSKETQRFPLYSIYNKPSAIPTSIKAKRDGQLSGKVKLSASGSYTPNIKPRTSAQVLTPSLTLYVYEGNTLKFYRNINTTDTEFTYSNGSWTLEDLQIGATSGTYYFDPTILYNLILMVNDELTNMDEGIEASTYNFNVLLGEPTWTEHPDYVDFKRITRQKGDIYGETILFNDTDGTFGDITLKKDEINESSANYEYLEIEYSNNSNNVPHKTVRLYSPNGKYAELSSEYDNGTNLFIYSESISISGATITRGTQTRWRIATSGNAQRSASNCIYIYRVVGYK